MTLHVHIEEAAWRLAGDLEMVREMMRRQGWELEISVRLASTEPGTMDEPPKFARLKLIGEHTTFEVTYAEVTRY